MHAAIIAINEAIESQVTADIMAALGNPAAMLIGITDDLGDNYAAHLFEAKQTKAKNAKNKVKSLIKKKSNSKTRFPIKNPLSIYLSSVWEMQADDCISSLAKHHVLISESESEMFTGDTSEQQSFTRIFYTKAE